MTANAPSGRVTNRVRCPQIIVVDDQAPHRRFSGHGRGPWAKVDHRDLAEESPDATTFAVPSRMTKRVCVRPPSRTMTSPASYRFSVELFKTRLSWRSANGPRSGRGKPYHPQPRPFVSSGGPTQPREPSSILHHPCRASRWRSETANRYRRVVVSSRRSRIAPDEVGTIPTRSGRIPRRE
jgi:hypothetical protein